jgi:hypothetical protein
MDKLRRSGRTRIATFGAVALAIGAFASLAATGYAARIVSLAHTSPTASQYPPSKVTICHHTHSKKNPFVTITVSQNAVAAHMRNHGDTIGPCPQTTQPVAPVAAVKAKAPKVHKAHKLHKAHKAKHSAGKSQLRGHGHASKPKKPKKPKSHGHGSSIVQPTAPTTVETKGNGQSKSHGQGKGNAKGHQKTHGSSQGQAKGHQKTHGSSQGHGPSHGQGTGGGQGHGQGHGPSPPPSSGDTHGGNPGGGKGNGH